MKINEVIRFLESLAHPSLQENYDNAGLVTGSGEWECRGILCSLDATEEVVREAMDRGCNLVVAHHPIIFSGLKKINGRNYVERTVVLAIKNDIAIYAIHTNLDNVKDGVSGRMASLLGLVNPQVLAPKQGLLKKLYTFAPAEHAGKVRDALFEAGAGRIGNYSECSFNAEGTGTFRAGDGANPFVGSKDSRHYEQEIRIEVVLPSYLEQQVVAALLAAHPYEEVAYDILTLANKWPLTGSGMIGQLPEPMDEKGFLEKLKQIFRCGIVRHTALTGKPVQRVALCGGAGSFLISNALAAGADAYLTADLKYHEFFDADGKMLLADLGHFESEQFTIDLLTEHLEQKFLTFAVLKTAVNTNPVHYC